MDMDAILALLDGQYLLILGAVLLIIALVAIIKLRGSVHQLGQEHDQLTRRLDTLWHDLDAMHQDDTPSLSGKSRTPATSVTSDTSPELLLAERRLFEGLWPVAWALHDKVGGFLRAVESGDPHSESRLAARNAALEMRSQINRSRPFFDAEIEGILTQLVDIEIKAHLTACQYLDQRQSNLGVSSEGSDVRESYRNKWRQLYDREANELINHLVSAMRKRLVRHVP